MSGASLTGPARRDPKRHKGVSVALQGGGAHGAFTWGVLDRLFEDDRLWIDAISGTSAGAMNAVVAAQGMTEAGPEGARRRLAAFWRAVSDAARTSPIQRSLWARLTGDWSLDSSPGYLAAGLIQRLASPYDLNPMRADPLRDLVGRLVDFDKVRGCGDMGVFVSATDVQTGQVRVFGREQISLDAVMASACLPHLFHAVEIDGAPYWDGGYAGNPPLFPLLHAAPSSDVLIVQINPMKREGTPKSAAEIQNRVNEITFNSSLTHELRAIEFLRRLVAAGHLDGHAVPTPHLHVVHARKRMRSLDASSKLNAEWAFLRHLFEIGREAADTWLAECFDDVGRRSSADIAAMFGATSVLPEI